MRSKLFSVFTSALVPLVFLSSCSQNWSPDFGDHVGTIGEKLSSLSALSDSSGQADRTQMVFFDKTVRRIHHFDLTTMKMVKSLPVENPDEIHTVIFDQNSGLIVDFSTGHLTIFDRNGVATTNPLLFSGKPKSAAYRPALGTLVVYDDLSNVGLLKFDGDGRITQKWMGGSLLDSTTGATITCGDLTDQGELVLALSDGTIAIVDVAQTLQDQNWRYRAVTPNIGRVSWLAPVRGTADHIMTLSATSYTDNTISTVSLVDGTAQSVTITAPVTIASKSRDPHIITTSYGGDTKMYYATPSGLAAPRALSTSLASLFDSRLSVSENSWTVLDGNRNYSWEYNGKEREYSQRTLKKYRFSDMLAFPKKDLPDQAALSVSNTYVVALYPNELGYAERISIADGARSVLKLFNLGHL